METTHKIPIRLEYSFGCRAYSLSNYGTEIGDWIKQLFDSREKLDILKEALKSYNETIIEGKKNAQDQIVELKMLYKAATDAAESTDTEVKP